MSAFYDLASLVVVPSGYKASKVYAQKPLTTDGQLAFTRSTTATRVNSAGLIESVGINVPRLDYLGSTCPKLQLEPQRSNSLVQNQNFSATWSFSQCTLGAAQTGPGGANTAYRITNGATATDPYFEQTVTTAAATWCWSIFVKQGTAAEAWIYPVHVGMGADTSYAKFNFSTKTFTNVGSIASAGYEQHANGWYRIWCTIAISAGVSSLRGRFGNPQVANAYNDWAYPQLEQGAYATSVIPTTTAAVTRGADAASKTGISSLFGSAFTLFVDVTKLEDNGPTRYLVAKGAGSTYQNFISFEKSSNGVLMVVTDGSATTVVAIQSGTYAVGQRMKIAARFQNGSYAFYINGVQIGVASTAFTPSISSLDLHYFDYYGNNAFNQVLVFPSALTNAQLAELTTI